MSPLRNIHAFPGSIFKCPGIFASLYFTCNGRFHKLSLRHCGSLLTLSHPRVDSSWRPRAARQQAQQSPCTSIPILKKIGWKIPPQPTKITPRIERYSSPRCETNHRLHNPTEDTQFRGQKKTRDLQISQPSCHPRIACNGPFRKAENRGNRRVPQSCSLSCCHFPWPYSSKPFHTNTGFIPGSTSLAS